MLNVERHQTDFVKKKGPLIGGFKQALLPRFSWPR